MPKPSVNERTSVRKQACPIGLELYSVRDGACTRDLAAIPWHRSLKIRLARSLSSTLRILKWTPVYAKYVALARWTI